MAARRRAAAPAPAPAPVATLTEEQLRAAAREARLFPVRHHSPRTSAVLRAFLRALRPQLILIEGPGDADGLIDVLCDAETAPPVAILGYRADDTPGSALWPFAAYSPEYVALKFAAEHKIPARFIDVPAGVALAAAGSPLKVPAAPADTIDAPAAAGAGATAGELPDADSPAGPGRDSAEQGGAPSLDERCAAAYGYRSFEEFWEAQFETPAYQAADFQAAILAYAELVRSGPQRPYDRARDAVMARRIAQAVAGGVPADRIAVVIGAAHAAALCRGDFSAEDEALLPPPLPCALTVIPFSFPRLAAQLGYGAGNRAPQFYQRAHDAGGDFRRAALETLCDFAARLRERGFTASLADSLEAYRLALALADLRGKAGPGLDEVREAAISVLCRGEAEHVDGMLWPSVLGQRVGVVARAIGKNALQEEFWREVRARRLPETDASEPQRFHLHFADALQRETSVFLHRLRVAGVPYAAYQGQNVVGGARRREGESDGGLAALLRRRETWTAGWSPATETALVEKIVLGDTLEQVASRVLHEALADARTTGAASEVLAEALLVRSATLPEEALGTCENLAAVDDDVASLAKATRTLAMLSSFGSGHLGDLSGGEGATGDAAELRFDERPALVDGAQRGGAPFIDALGPLAERLFLRAVLRAEAACHGNDEAAEAILPALRTLHDVALGPRLADRDTWLEVARRIALSASVHARCAGFACGLLFQSALLPEDQVVAEVTQRLSGVSDPVPASAFLTGFFAVNAVLLVRNRAVVQAIDAFLCQLDGARFREALPLLRRAFSPLGATERRYLLENLIALRGLFEQRHEARAVLRETDSAALKTINEDLGKVLDDLDDLL